METYRWSSIAVFNCCVPVLPAIVQELKPHLPVLVHMLHTVSFPLRCTIPVGFLQATWLATNLFTFCAYVFQCSRSLSPSLPLYVSRALHAPSLPPSLPPSLTVPGVCACACVFDHSGGLQGADEALASATRRGGVYHSDNIVLATSCSISPAKLTLDTLNAALALFAA